MASSTRICSRKLCGMHRSVELQPQVCIQIKIPHTTHTTVTERAPTCPKCNPAATHTADPCSGLTLNTSLPPDKFSQIQSKSLYLKKWSDFQQSSALPPACSQCHTSLGSLCLSLPSSSVFCFLFFLDFVIFLFFRSTSSLMRWATENSEEGLD